jgi:hypothetical protein
MLIKSKTEEKFLSSRTQGASRAEGKELIVLVFFRDNFKLEVTLKGIHNAEGFLKTNFNRFHRYFYW